jgi:UDP-N-acetyl-D-glucosamine dehydrogenase
MIHENNFTALRRKIESHEAPVGVCGLGYVGLPLAIAASRARFPVLGFDIDATKVAQLNAGTSYLGTVADGAIGEALATERFEATDDFARLAESDVIVICVPTPLTRHREPDLSYVENTSRTIAKALRPGQLVILESTSYPGTTEEVVKPILEETGLRSGVDFFLGFSPEREDPGNAVYGTTTIPKVVSGEGREASELAALFYGSIVEKVVPVSSTRTAEAVKITENIFRAINIALVNELKIVFRTMGIDIWEVIEAAKTKPFGYMPFYPGPGLGGHCIPIDPFYLTWKAREHGVPTRFIELAGEINTAMPRYVIGLLEEALDQHASITLSRARVLILGMAYKKNVADIRESPALVLLDLLEKRGAATAFHDPHVDEIPPTREHGHLAGRRSVPLTPETLAQFDAVLLVTDHDAIDYPVLRDASLVVDTRNACLRRGIKVPRLVQA